MDNLNSKVQKHLEKIIQCIQSSKLKVCSGPGGHLHRSPFLTTIWMSTCVYIHEQVLHMCEKKDMHAHSSMFTNIYVYIIYVFIHVSIYLSMHPSICLSLFLYTYVYRNLYDTHTYEAENILVSMVCLMTIP